MCLDSVIQQPFLQDMMRSLKHKRVEAPRISTFEDVHPYTKWTMCIRVYDKFHIERFGPGRKRLDMVLLDENVIHMRTFTFICNSLYFDRNSFVTSFFR
jgi:hypothetical protein